MYWLMLFDLVDLCLAITNWVYLGYFLFVYSKQMLKRVPLGYGYFVLSVMRVQSEICTSYSALATQDTKLMVLTIVRWNYCVSYNQKYNANEYVC